jgi:hypothetical protein
MLLLIVVPHLAGCFYFLVQNPTYFFGLKATAFL